MSARGYTLIEITVATGIFALLIVLFVGIFSRFVSVQERGSEMQAIQEQLRVALELMNREVRTGFGSTYDVIDGVGSGIAFRNQNGVCAYYRWQDASIERGELEAGGDTCPLPQGTSVTFAPLISNAITVTNARFDVVRAEIGGDGLENQGVVTIILEAEGAQEAAPLQLQSSVTSRQVIPYVQ